LRPEKSVVLRCGSTTIAEARQQGALASSGSLLVFADADVEFDSGYFRRLLRRMDWDGVCGSKRSRDEFGRDYDLMLHAQTIAYRWLGIAGASGSNMAIKRDAFEALGGFRLKLRCNEDTELFLRAGRFGMRMQFDEHLIVWARDHRRLRRGRTRKAAHSFIRNCLLYVMCRWPRLPAFLEDDWGYWSQPA
jgi:GT2 family glycosyltransferase